MTVREFLALVEAHANPHLPPEARTRIAFGFVQVQFADPRVHFECWVQRRTAVMEIGLHFEGRREFSYGWAAAFAPEMPAVHAALGVEPSLEDWTERWARLHERWDAPVLDEALASRAAVRLVEYVAALQPIVERLAPTIVLADIPETLRRHVHRLEDVPPDFAR